MTIIASIDGTLSPRLVYLHLDTVGTTLHPIDIYKAMRTLRGSDESLRKFDLFMQADGNVSKGGGKFTERYVTLLNTRIVPYDTSHVLTINGTLITDDGQEGIFAFDKAPLSPTTSVDIAYIPPQVEVIEVISGSGLSVAQDAKLTQISVEVKYIERFVHVNTELVVNGIGTQKEPFNNLPDALDYAEANGIFGVHTASDLTLDRDVKNFVFIGIGYPVIDFAGYNLTQSEFTHCILKGNSIGKFVASDCKLFNTVQVYGTLKFCEFLGIIEQMGDSIYENCFSGLTGLAYAGLKVTAGDAGVRGFRGSIGVSNCIAGEHSIGIASDGRIILEATCTGGHIHARGFPFEIVRNQGVGCTVFDETESEKVTNLPVANKKELLGTTSFP